MTLLIVAAVLAVGLLAAVGAIGVKHRREHEAELRHYDEHKRRR
jgi:hypothetical protein